MGNCGSVANSGETAGENKLVDAVGEGKNAPPAANEKGKHAAVMAAAAARFA